MLIIASFLFLLSLEEILGDGNCYFRALAFLVTGSQDGHIEFRTLITTYIAHIAGFILDTVNQ